MLIADSPLVSRCVVAKHWRPLPARTFPIQGGIAHITVNQPLTPAIAVARFFEEGSVEASSTYVVGFDEIIQCVPESGEPYAAAGANLTHFHVEIVGMPTMTSAEWIASLQFQSAARLFAERFAALGIPAVLVDAEGLLRGDRGLSTHWDVTQAVRLAHKRGLVHSPFFTSERGHHDPYATEAGPVPGVDQFDLEAFYGMMIDSFPRSAS